MWNRHPIRRLPEKGQSFIGVMGANWLPSCAGFKTYCLGFLHDITIIKPHFSARRVDFSPHNGIEHLTQFIEAIRFGHHAAKTVIGIMRHTRIIGISA